MQFNSFEEHIASKGTGSSELSTTKAPALSKRASKVVGVGVLAGAALVLSMASGVKAQTVVWGTPTTITGISNISTLGTYIDAINFSGPAHPTTDNNQNYTVQTIGDTTFHASTFAALPAVPTGEAESGNGQVKYLATDSSHIAAVVYDGFNTGANGGSNFSTATPSSAAYSTVLSNSAYIASGSATQVSYITLSGLTVGDTYQMQIWSYYLQTGYNNSTYFGNSSDTVTLNPNLGTSTAGGQYVLGTFVPTATTYSLAWGFATGTGTNDSANLNDLALRDITATVPEPTSAALAAGVIGSIAAFRRRR